MSIILVEGFDALTPTLIGSTYPNSSTHGPDTVSGRFGGLAFRPGPGNQNGAFSIALSGLQTFSAGAALLLTGTQMGGMGTGVAIIRVEGASGRQFSIGVDNTGAIKVGTGATLTLATSAAAVVTGDTYHYWEIAIYIHDTLGSIKVDIDGVNRINLTNVDTKGQTATVATALTYNAAGNGNGGLAIDDVYVKDDLTLLGPQRVETIRPTSDSSIAWTPNSGTNNFSRVGDTVSDGDTSYVSASATSTLDQYGLSDLTGIPLSISAVAPVMIARMDDAGPRTVRFGVRSGAVSGWSSARAMSSSYVVHQHIMETNPDGGGAWDLTAVNGLLGQIEVVS